MADVAQRKARDVERARRYRAKRKAAAEEKEERAKRQRLEDYEELKVSFMYFFVDITFLFVARTGRLVSAYPAYAYTSF